MFNPSRTVIDAFVETTVHRFNQAFPNPDRPYAGVLEQSARMGLEAFANSDSAYHDLDHTVMVTDVGQSILWGRLMSHGDVSAHDWLHATIGMLYHDIGFIRGALKGDRGGQYIINELGETLVPPTGATDAYLAPYHVSRGCMFVKERFATEPLIDVATLAQHIEITRFPVPEDAFYQRVADFSGLVRAADLIGQLADPRYIQKLSKLYVEFQETGETDRLGYANAGDLRADYPSFFFNRVRPYISEGLRFLRLTQEGQQWVANLFSHVYSEQQGEPSFGPERRNDSIPPQNKGRRASDRQPPQIAISNP